MTCHWDTYLTPIYIMDFSTLYALPLLEEEKERIITHGLLQTHINFPRFLPIFPDFLERLSHLAPIYQPLSPETTKCSSPLTVQTLSPHGYHAYCSVPHARLISASLITHGMQPCTCLPRDSHMHTAHLTLSSWLASLPLHGCTDTPVILMDDSWTTHVAQHIVRSSVHIAKPLCSICIKPQQSARRTSVLSSWRFPIISRSYQIISIVLLGQLALLVSVGRFSLYHCLKSSRHTLNQCLTLLNLYLPLLCLNSLPELGLSQPLDPFLRYFQRCSIGLRSGDCAGLSRSLIP